MKNDLRAWIGREIAWHRSMLIQHQNLRDMATWDFHRETGRILAKAREAFLAALDAELNPTLPDAAWQDKVVEFVRAGNVIHGIRELRVNTGLGLIDSKAIVADGLDPTGKFQELARRCRDLRKGWARP